MIIPMLCVTIFVILVVWLVLPWFARLMIHTTTAMSICVCMSMVQLMAVFISMRCTLCGHFLQVALTLRLVVGYAIAASEIACKIRGLMVTVCPSQFATRRTLFHVLVGCGLLDRKSGSAGMPRPTSYAAFCLKKKSDSFDDRSLNTFSLQVTLAASHPPTTTIACNPTSVVVGQSSTCAAIVTDTSTTGATIPTGSVTFTPNGGCTLAAGTCSASVIPISAGSISVSANYQGDTTHTGSTSNTVALTVSVRTTATSLTCVSPVSAGSATTCTVTVADTSTASLPGINPTGTVTVTSSGTGTFTGTCNLAPITTPPIPIGTTTCQVTFTPSGTISRTDTITADYGGDAVHSGSSGTLQLSITVNQTPPTVSFT